MHKLTIGLEIHCELKTKSKMFCGCRNNADETRANLNACPICLAHPGTLPVINRKAVESVLTLGLALNGKIPSVSRFDRKSYFYPDLPKGYQISQFKQPLVKGGNLNGVKITRIHLEEDTGALAHFAPIADQRGKFLRQSASGQRESASLVDFNRAGVPLMELVTEPDIKSGEEAVSFAKELRLILRYLGISEANMEKGQMRVEVNISLSRNNEMGTKVEIKNLNSFKTVKEAIDYEAKRQARILDEGKEVIRETRGWDEAKKITASQRSKEKAHDYRYFPEPDLPIILLRKIADKRGLKSRINADKIENIIDLEKLKAEIPELPAEKRNRFGKEYGLTSAQTEILVSDIQIANYFEEVAGELKLQASNFRHQTSGANFFQILFNYLTSDLFGLMTERGIAIKDFKISPKNCSIPINRIQMIPTLNLT